MPGQINRGMLIGDALAQLAANRNFTTYVEVGTWNGQGSTKCLMDIIFQRADMSRLYSLEANIEFYEQATSYWAPIIKASASIFKVEKLNLLYGRIIEKSDLITEEEVKSHPRFATRPWLEWRTRNCAEYDACENVCSQLPEIIDVLFLDGGQFSTRPEFSQLKDRVKVVALDDTSTYKTESIREEILKNIDQWTVVLDEPSERNGVFVACKTEYLPLLKG